MTPKKSVFREDINGLRAIAVIAVVLFHFNPERLPGGFAGVDVFFVISGYLMTSIIFRGFEGNGFSFWRFVLSRAKRILPALLTVTLILMILGYVTLGAEAYKMLARHVRDSLLFISNITYEKESGYFDVSSNTKFLLHTWSLSVEWQFYIIYPLILMVLKRFLSISALKGVVILMLMVSLASSVFITKINPDKAYFMFYTRSWEMLFGGGAYLYPLRLKSDKLKFALEAIGLSLIGIAIIKIKITTPWPGYMALLPVVGTYFCIAANNNKTILSGLIIGCAGLWSYSIYLVHWPVLVFDHILGWDLSFKQYIAIVIALAFLLFQFIEKRRNYKWGLFILFFVVLLTAIYVRNTNGLEKRFNNIPAASELSLQQGNLGWRPQEWIVFNEGGQIAPDYVFYGDSFSGQYASYFIDSGRYIANLYEGECLSSPSFYSHFDICKPLYSLLKDKSNQYPFKNLVIAQSWGHALSGLKGRDTDKLEGLSIDEFISKYREELYMIKSDLNIDKIILIGTNNHFSGLAPRECLSGIFTRTIYQKYTSASLCDKVVPRNVTESVATLNAGLKKLSEEVDWLYFIDPNDAVCDKDDCIQIEDNLSLYADGSHFSTYGAKKVGGYIFEQLDKIEREPK